jgi:hypothetical protein
VLEREQPTTAQKFLGRTPEIPGSFLSSARKAARKFRTLILTAVI